MFVAMNRLFMLVDSTCGVASDLTASEYSMLANVSEHDSGLPIREIQPPYEYAKNPFFDMELLEQKELVERIRDVSDRRGYALALSEKGKERLSLAEEMVGISMIEVFPLLDEDSFEHLVELLHTLSSRCDSGRSVKSLFPGIPLRMLIDYRMLSERECSHYGMSIAQVVVLCTLERFQGICSVGQLANVLAMPEEAVERFLDSLEKRDLVHVDRLCCINERGKRRVEAIVGQVGAVTKHAIEEHGFAEANDLLLGLAEYCMYLFA